MTPSRQLVVRGGSVVDGTGSTSVNGRVVCCDGPEVGDSPHRNLARLSIVHFRRCGGDD